MTRFMKIIPVILFLAVTMVYAKDSKTIYFKSKDGVDIASELYMPHPKSAPFIVLFHQANWSRGEYKEIAPKLNSMGYNCMAVDLRSGGSVNDVANQTKLNAVKAMKDTQYIHALPDMRAAVTYADTHFAEGKLIIWGSSYSAALSIKVGSEMKDQVDGILAFSPGEYFSSEGRDYIASAAQKIDDPIFITSAKGEKTHGGVFMWLYLQKIRPIIYPRLWVTMVHEHYGVNLQMLTATGQPYLPFCQTFD